MKTFIQIFIGKKHFAEKCLKNMKTPFKINKISTFIKFSQDLAKQPNAIFSSQTPLNLAKIEEFGHKLAKLVALLVRKFQDILFYIYMATVWNLFGGFLHTLPLSFSSAASFHQGENIGFSNTNNFLLLKKPRLKSRMDSSCDVSKLKVMTKYVNAH